MMRLLVLAMWFGFAFVLYKGLSARLLPHQPRWQAGAMVAIVFGLLLAGVGVQRWAAQRPMIGAVYDGGEEYRSGRPETL